MRRTYTGTQRSGLIDLVLAGGVTVAEAAARSGVAKSTAYLWVRQAAADAGRPAKATGGRTQEPKQNDAPAFVRLVRETQADDEIVVRVGGAEVRVRRGFDAGLLRAVVAALGEVEA